MTRLLSPVGVKVPPGTPLLWRARAGTPKGGASPWSAPKIFTPGVRPPVTITRTSVISGTARIAPAVVNAQLDIRTGDTVTASYTALWTKTGWSPWVQR